MKKFISLFASALLVTSLLAGCAQKKEQTIATEAPKSSETTSEAAKPEAGKKVVIGVSIRGLDNPYYVQIKEGAEMFAKKTFPDGNYELRVMECQGSDDKQINDVKAFLASVGKDAILYVDPNNAPNAAVIADLCEEAGVYWSTTWSYADGVYPMDYKYYVMHQTADNEAGGYAAAKAMFASFKTPGKGKILAVLGMITNDASIDREKGLKKALAENPGVELLDTQPGNWNAQESLTLTQTWLTKYNDIDGIWVANDSMALAVAEALRAKGLNGKVKVTGFDCIDDVLPAIENGDIFATYSSNAYLQAGYGLAYTYAAYSGALDTETMAPEKRMINTKGIAVTTDNLKDFKAEFIESKPVYDYTDLDFPISKSFDLKALK